MEASHSRRSRFDQPCARTSGAFFASDSAPISIVTSLSPYLRCVNQAALGQACRAAYVLTGCGTGSIGRMRGRRTANGYAQVLCDSPVTSALSTEVSSACGRIFHRRSLIHVHVRTSTSTHKPTHPITDVDTQTCTLIHTHRHEHTRKRTYTHSISPLFKNSVQGRNSCSNRPNVFARGRSQDDVSGLYFLWTFSRG